jgi:outer membrane protein OmpA-like peptidoglycan-associated protein
LPKVLQIETSRKSALLTVAMVSTLAMAQWFLASESVPAAPAPGTIILAQNPPQPKCGQDPQHPCPKEAPKEAPKQPAPKEAPKQPAPQAQPQQQQQAPKQQAQPQPQPTPPPAPAQPQLKQQAQPQPQPTPPPAPAQPLLKQQAQPKDKEQPKDKDKQKPVVQQPVVPGQPPAPTGQPPVQTQQHTLPTPGQPVQTQGQPPVQPQGQQPQQGQQGQQVVPGQQRPAQGQPVPPQGQPQQPQQGQQVVPGQQQRIQPAQGQPVQPTPGPAGQQRIQPAQGQPPQGQQQPAQTFQRVRPLPGQPGWVPPVQQTQVGAGKPAPAPAQAAGPGFANVQDLRAQRHEHTEAGGRVVIEEPDHRQIVREGGQAFVRHDENERLFQFGEGRRERRDDGMYAIIVRPDGGEIVTVTDDDGRLLRRFRRERDGQEYILIDNRRPRGATVFLDLPVPIIGIPQDQYIVDTGMAPEPFIYQTLAAPPLVAIERPYSLDEIRYNAPLRDRMRRIDVDSINFDTGSWEVAPEQVARLQLVAQAIQDAVARNPNEVFLIEGHTDAVGTDVDNLSLSDRRAETVAGILTESFQIPPENLTSQGYGSHYLKIPTPEANRQNRRVTVRRITPLLNGGKG